MCGVRHPSPWASNKLIASIGEYSCARESIKYVRYYLKKNNNNDSNNIGNNTYGKLYREQRELEIFVRDCSNDAAE